MKKRNNITIDFSNGEFAEHVSGAGVYLKELEILIECGYSQSNNLVKDYHNNNKQFNFSCKELKAILVSHCHIDHIGRIPLLYKRGCDAPIFITKGSKPIMRNMLEDSVKINERDSLLLSKQTGKINQPIYSFDDVAQTMEHVIEIEPFQLYEVNENVKIRFIPAGHIKYSAQIELFTNNKKLVYTGDLGNCNLPKHFTDKFVPIEKCDILIGETTYADGHRPRANSKLRKKDIEKLTAVIQHYCIETQSRILIPCFSLDRTPEMYMTIREILKENGWDDLQVVIDSPLAIKQLQLYGLKHPELIEEIQNSNTKLITSYTVSTEYQQSQKRMIILSSSGMLNAGRVLSYLPHILPNSNNCVVFCGYSTEGTLAGDIKQGKKKRVKVGNDWVTNRANIVNLQSFSSHMQHDELLDYYSTIQCNKIYLVHGQMDAKLEFSHELKLALEKKNRSTQVVCVNKGTKGKL